MCPQRLHGFECSSANQALDLDVAQFGAQSVSLCDGWPRLRWLSSREQDGGKGYARNMVSNISAACSPGGQRGLIQVAVEHHTDGQKTPPVGESVVQRADPDAVAQIIDAFLDLAVGDFRGAERGPGLSIGRVLLYGGRGAENKATISVAWSGGV